MGLGQHPHNVVALKDAGRDQGCLGGCLVCTPKEGKVMGPLGCPKCHPPPKRLAYPLTAGLPAHLCRTTWVSVYLPCRYRTFLQATPPNPTQRFGATPIRLHCAVASSGQVTMSRIDLWI